MPPQAQSSRQGAIQWQRRNSRPLKPEYIVVLVLSCPLAALALIFALTGQWKAVEGAAILAVLLSVPACLLVLAARRTRRFRQYRAMRRQYKAGLATRADLEHQAIMRGDIEAGVFGAYLPPGIDRKDLPDAAQMRQRAWQPDLTDSPAVRPQTPAPWHIVTQVPTSQFRQGAPD